MKRCDAAKAEIALKQRKRKKMNFHQKVIRTPRRVRPRGGGGGRFEPHDERRAYLTTARIVSSLFHRDARMTDILYTVRLSQCMQATNTTTGSSSTVLLNCGV